MTTIKNLTVHQYVMVVVGAALMPFFLLANTDSVIFEGVSVVIFEIALLVMLVTLPLSVAWVTRDNPHHSLPLAIITVLVWSSSYCYQLPSVVESWGDRGGMNAMPFVLLPLIYSGIILSAGVGVIIWGKFFNASEE